MEIVGIIAIVTLALLFTGRSWRKIFKNIDRAPGCTHADGCQRCYGCSTSYKKSVHPKETT